MHHARGPITLVHVTGESGFSGGEAQLLLLVEGLSKRGHRNIILCPSESRINQEARKRGFDVCPIRMRSEWSPRSHWEAHRQLSTLMPDLVILHTGRANWVGGVACRRLHLPAITVRRMDRRVKQNWRTRWLYGSATRRAVAISAAVRKRLIAGGVDPSMIQLIRSSIEPRAFIAGRGRCAVRAAEGVDAGTPCLLVVASLVHRKGIDVLLKALARLASDGLEPVLWIAGEGEEHSNLERLSTRLQLTKQVRFLGQRDDVADLIQASDLVVLPSRLEGLGVAALEAMALGRPVVASNVGGLAEAIDDEHTGLLVPPEDPAALAAALARLTQDPALRRRLGDAGPQRIEAEYHSEGMTDQYERLCFTILEEAQPT